LIIKKLHKNFQNYNILALIIRDVNLVPPADLMGSVFSKVYLHFFLKK